MRLVTASALLIAVPAMAATYTDPTGDIATGNPNLDIVSVDVSHTISDVVISMKLDDLNGDWGKYGLVLDFKFGGAGDNDNPWSRDIAGLEGIDMFVGTWIDNGGGIAEYYYTPAGWAPTPLGVSMNVDFANSTISWTLGGFASQLSAFGADTFGFELFTTGGNEGDPAIDLLGGEGTQPGWGNGSVSTDLSYYSIPAPGALALLGLAGLAGRRRRR
tara:strand:+ start:12674 stop:13324 length:651 start_codon:yes stop_codon:yes gene_type:complete